MNFHVGQKVVCVDDSPHPYKPWCQDERPYLGSVYTVTRCFTDQYDCLILWLAEIKRCDGARSEWGPDVGYAAYRFRPIVERKTDISIFQAMLTPSPKQPIREKTAKQTNAVPLPSKSPAGERPAL